MKTVYLLKNSPKSFSVLLKLVKMGDITTNIIVVDSFFSKILKRDPRVKKFPFVINTLPTSKGLIPKIAKVLPFNMFVYNFNFFNKQKLFNKQNLFNKQQCYNKQKKLNKRFNSGRIITYKPPLNRSPKLKSTYKKPVIRTIKQKDKSVNIILYN